MTTFAQLSKRLKNFLGGWLLVLDIKEGLVESATVCVKSVVILDLPILIRSISNRMKAGYTKSCQINQGRKNLFGKESRKLCKLWWNNDKLHANKDNFTKKVPLKDYEN